MIYKASVENKDQDGIAYSYVYFSVITFGSRGILYLQDVIPIHKKHVLPITYVIS